MYVGVVCAVFILSVRLGSCLTNLTANTVSVTANGDIQRPQLSALDKYLRTQPSIVLLNVGRSNDDVVVASSSIQNVTSQNYPLPYPVPKTVKQRLAVTNSNGMDIIVNDLDIDPTSDYISLIPLNTDGSESRPIILTGKLKEPLSIRSLGFTRVDLVFQSRSFQGHVYKGFSISYLPYGEVRSPSTQPPDYTLPYDQLQTTSKLLVIPKNEQTEKTWSKLKRIFASSTNSFIEAEKLSFEKATPQNVTLTRVAECFENWPNAENCIEVEFAVTLYNDTSLTPTVVDPFFEDLTPREPAGLSNIQLELMWAKFGRETLQRSGISEYELPDTRSQVLTWVGVAVGCCVLMFLVLVGVFRSPAFRDRWVEDDTVAIKPKEEIPKGSTDDITMYPSPDQIIPEMYPGYQSASGANGHVRPNTYDTINEESRDGEGISSNITSRSEQSQPDAPV